MALHAAWKGHLRISLVSLPVQAFTTSAGSKSDDISFNQLHETCHNRIRYKKVCPIHGEVPSSEIVSGYEFQKGQYVVLDRDELDAVRIQGDKAIDVATFVPLTSIDPALYAGQAYYLVPDGKMAQKTYGLIRQGLADEGVSAIGEVVISRKQKLVSIRAAEDFLVMDCLYYEGELRDREEIPTPSASGGKTTAAELKLLKSLVEGMSQESFDPSAFREDYNERVREVIEAKIAGKEVTAVRESKEPDVINLMDAIKKSLKMTTPAPRAAGRKSRTTKGNGRSTKRPARKSG